MRVLEIGKYYPPQRGGMETALADLSTGLSRRGHQVEVLVSAGGDHGVEEALDGVRVRRVPSWGTLFSVPVSPSLPAVTREIVRSRRPDLVHLHLPHPLAALACLRLPREVPLAISYHSDVVRQRRLGRLYAPLGRRILARARRILVSSDALVRSSESLAEFRERCEVVPLGVDTARWSRPDPLRVQTWNRQEGERFLLFVGRLVYYKGLDVLLEALRGTPLRVVVAGEGPMRREWETLARVLGVADRVRFVGEVSEDSLPALYAAARAFVLPSSAPSETFGLVQLEAMAAGLAVVACRASEGMASVHVEGETALLVPPRDPERLREALLRVWEDDALVEGLGAAARRRVRAFYELERCLDRTEKVLLEAAGRSDAP